MLKQIKGPLLTGQIEARALYPLCCIVSREGRVKCQGSQRGFEGLHGLAEPPLTQGWPWAGMAEQGWEEQGTPHYHDINAPPPPSCILGKIHEPLTPTGHMT